MTNDKTYSGQCFCGAVTVETTGAPFAMGYCHCKDCRGWAAAPVNGFTLWHDGAVQVTKGKEHVGAYNKTEMSDRKFCTQCGGHIMSIHPGAKFTDVYSAILPDLEFKPTMHVNYESSVLSIKDGLPKYLDFPEDFGGSGKTAAE